jgi:hypothetical protein
VTSFRALHNIGREKTNSVGAQLVKRIRHGDYAENQKMMMIPDCSLVTLQLTR